MLNEKNPRHKHVGYASHHNEMAKFIIHGNFHSEPNTQKFVHHQEGRIGLCEHQNHCFKLNLKHSKIAKQHQRNEITPKASTDIGERPNRNIKQQNKIHHWKYHWMIEVLHKGKSNRQLEKTELKNPEASIISVLRTRSTEARDPLHQIGPKVQTPKKFQKMSKRNNDRI